jgi:hypothetical protein
VNLDKLRKIIEANQSSEDSFVKYIAAMTHVDKALVEVANASRCPSQEWEHVPACLKCNICLALAALAKAIEKIP